jgi:hypothetical protein
MTGTLYEKLHASLRHEYLIYIYIYVRVSCMRKVNDLAPLLYFSYLFYLTYLLIQTMSGFGGLMVSMLASGTQDRGLETGRNLRIFRAKNIHNMPSFGVKPCRRFAACKRTL